MATKIRIIPTLLFKEVGLVKGVRFDSWRRVGSAMQAIKVYNMREVDELIFLDIMATRDGRSPDFDTVDELADECFMPMTVGGGIKITSPVTLLPTNTWRFRKTPSSPGLSRVSFVTIL